MTFIRPFQRENIVIFNGREHRASEINEMNMAMHRIVSKEREKRSAKTRVNFTILKIIKKFKKNQQKFA